MKTCIKNLLLVPLLMAGLGLMLAGRVTAQTFTSLHSFTALNSSTNSDGANPYAGLILSGNTLYGTAPYGGSSGNYGTVFKVNTDGSGFTTLHSFNSSDGANLSGSLVLSGTTLYGTAQQGGSAGNGTVFVVNTNGTAFTNLYSFTGSSDGAYPQRGLILSSNALYGTTYYGGNSDNGTVFKINTNGTGFTNLHNFTALNNSTNNDGANPSASLLLSGNTLYGTTQKGGSSGNGAVFAVNANGIGFTNLHSFTATDPNIGTNCDGANPSADLILSGNTLYGTARHGGSSGYGTLFKVNVDGTSFTNLHSFTYGDGANPFAGLILSGNTLYGTAVGGGSSGYGAVFAVNTDGTGFRNLYSFTALPSSLPQTNRDGALPYAGLILSGDTLYGTTWLGGSSGNGTVFSLSFAPQLTIIRSGANVVLTWPTNSPGSITPGSLCNPPRTLFHRRSGSPILPHQSSSTGRTQSPIPPPRHRRFSG